MKKPIQFGKYLLLNRVNVGGMAEVFRAKTFGVEGFERYVAIKRILPSIAEDEKFIEMFIDEAKITVQLQHANIAQIETLGKIDDSHFIAMEFIDGKDIKQLFEYIKRKGVAMDIAQACYIISQVCSGLDYAHKKKNDKGVELGIIHRDISPQNIRVSYDGEVKIIDFGIAKAKNKSTKTEAGILKGKFAYMSPEQVRGKEIDRRSDIFAVGIVFYELVTGSRLFQGESDFSTLEQIRNVNIEPPRKRNPEIPKRLEEIIMKALAAKPNNRYKYAIELHDDLQKFMILNDYFYSRSDLSKWMREVFSVSLAKEKAKLVEYEELYKEEVEPEIDEFELDFQPDIEWDDDELETAIFDRSPSFVGLEPEPEKKSNNLINVIEEKRKKQKEKKNKKVLIFALLFLLILGIGAGLLFTGFFTAEEIIIKYKMDLQLLGTPTDNVNILLNNKLKDVNTKLPYTLKELQPGTYNVEVKKDGYDSFKQNVTFPKLTAKKIEELKHLQANDARNKFGITYDDYNKGILDLNLKLTPAKLKTLTIKTVPDNVKISIDNKEVANKTPFILNNLPYKKELTLKIEKKGYKTLIEKITVNIEDIKKNKKDLMFHLEKGKKVTLTIITPKDAILTIDNKKIDGKTPYKVDLLSGKHKFQIKSNLYQSITKEINCSKDSKINLTSKQKFVNLKFDVLPGTSIIFFDKNNMKSSLASGVLSSKIELGNLNKILFEKKGYNSQSIKYVWNKKNTQIIKVNLTKKGTTTKNKRVNVVVKRRKSYGFLSMMSIPNTKIKIDGKPHGKTPLVKFKLTTGKHKVNLSNPSKGINDSFWINIKKGEVKPLIKRY